MCLNGREDLWNGYLRKAWMRRHGDIQALCANVYHVRNPSTVRGVHTTRDALQLMNYRNRNQAASNLLMSLLRVGL